MKKSIGEIIREKVKESGMTVVDFADRIGKDRTNIYDMYKRKSFDTEDLQKIGEVLEYDFFEHFLQEGTVERLKMKHRLEGAKILVEIELTDEEREGLQLGERVRAELDAMMGNVAEPEVQYGENDGDGDGGAGTELGQ